MKDRPEPEWVHWLIGTRRDGGGDPLAYRALDVLERIFAPLRPFAPEGAGEDLILGFQRTYSAPIKAIVPRGIIYKLLAKSLRVTLGDQLDLSSLTVRSVAVTD